LKRHNRIIGVFGRIDSGKSTLIRGEKRLNIKSILSEFQQFIIWDYQKEYNIKEAEIFEDFNVYIDALKLAIKTKRKIKFILRFPYPIQVFEKVCKSLYYVTDCLFLIEEIDIVMNSKKVSPIFEELIHSSAHRGISLIYTTRRPALIPRLLTGQTKEIYVFRFTEPIDLDYFKNLLRINIDDIRFLNEHECFHNSNL